MPTVAATAFQQILWLDALVAEVTTAQALDAASNAVGPAVACTLVRRGLTAVNTAALGVSAGQAFIRLSGPSGAILAVDVRGPANAGSVAVGFGDR